MGKKPIIGITGAVGSGKTTVAKEFGKLGCGVISADELNHQVLRRKEVIDTIRGWWGDEILDASGQIDRSSLGKIVFEDEKALKRLTDLVHPLIEQLQQQLMAKYMADPAVAAIVLDVPLLFEVGQEKWCDFLVFVSSDEAVRRKRLQKMRVWDLEKIKNIENLQLTLDFKQKMSDHIVQNNSGIPDLTMQVAKMFAKMVGKVAST